MVHESPWRDWKRAAAITTVVLSVALLYFLAAGALLALSRVLAYLLIALFFTVILTPAVDFMHARLHIRRGMGTILVFLLAFTVLGAMIYSFVRPIVDQGQKLADDLPTLLEDAQKGEGPVGDLVQRYELEDWVRENEEKINDSIGNLGTPALDALRTFFNGLFAGLTILVLTVLMILEGPNLSRVILMVIPEHSRERVRRVSTDAARAVSGYMTGNLLISVVAGVAAYVFLKIAGVPYPEVLALWVAFADLIPLVGATLGAVPTIAVAFLKSNTAGIATLVFFVLYQQFENNVLQVTVMSRTVKINPLGVLVSVLIGVELFGLLGALLAIPAAGVIQVIVRDLWNGGTGHLKDEPTIGSDEVPMSQSKP
jgi:predicted PurR-regulated permease PerM